MANCESCGGKCGLQFCVQKVPVFSSLDLGDLSHIASLIHHRDYRKGEVLFSEKDLLNELVIVHSGSVKAYKMTPDGREQILYIFQDGDFFGERNLFGDQTASYTVEALKSVKTCSFSKESFRALLYEHPDIAIKIIEELEERMARMENALKSIGVRSVDGRISALLLDFADRYGTRVPEGTLIRLPLSREGIANQLGIARETMSRKLGQFEIDGVIRSVSNKSILILDRNALAAAADLSD